MAYTAPLLLIPTQRISGVTVSLPAQGIMSDRQFEATMLSVPSATGIGTTITIINATILGRHWVPQPFLSYLNEIHLVETTLPNGFVGYLYALTQLYDGTATVAVVSGSLPPGMGLVVTLTNVAITGTPTTAGAYTFTLRFTVGVATTDYLYHMTILADPNEGAGGVGGG